jgi:hypothetical protein
MVQKILMMPQIVEVIKNIHHIAEVNQLGIAVGADINIESQKFSAISTDLKTSMVELLSVLRSNANRHPDLKNLIKVIEKHMRSIDDWIAFPKLIEVEKTVFRDLEKEKVVLVPTHNKDKEATLFYMLDKTINELRRIKDSHKININLDEDILKIFFQERDGEGDLEHRIEGLKESLIGAEQQYGSINYSRPFIVGTAMDEILKKEAKVMEYLNTIKNQENEIDRLKRMM